MEMNANARISALRVFWLALLAVLLMASPAGATSPAEDARVEALLQALEQENGTVFIRNGSEHDAREAADHLRGKYRRSKSRLESAEQFIDKVGTRSSISGRDYEVRRPGGQSRPAGPYLHQILKRVAPAR